MAVSNQGASIPVRVDAETATVRRQFDARAQRFSGHDAIVRETEARMLERLACMQAPSGRILDLGCGLGSSRAGLLARFPRTQWLGVDLSLAMLAGGRPRATLLERVAARVLGAHTARRGGLRVCADAAQLPLADASVDLVFSNLMLHWHPAPHAVIAEAARALRAGGLLLFSGYGPDTLRELRAACAQALPGARAMPCVDMHDLGDMLVAAGFDAPVMERDNIVLHFGTARSLLAEARALGGNPRADRSSALPSGERARALLAALAGGRDGAGRIPLTFEIVIGHGWRAAARAARVPREQVLALPVSRRQADGDATCGGS